MHTFYDNLGNPMTLTFDPAIYTERVAKHVLVFAFWDGKLLFTLHTKRGIELPGGKVEPGETSMAAAVRETYEETGCTLSSIEKIGQYTVEMVKTPDGAENHGNLIVKDIFLAHVEKQEREMIGGTVGGLVLLEQIPSPDEVRNNTEFSPFLYDEVYPLTLRYLEERGLLGER
ncbi:NUDIX domain-containing protein [Brevibacillus dissolubilis]|uniref:NUDIX domain-containing protein n=1 Tax=Brevibacillus dissolubilis TaxID=1844116 RepID=UPI001116F4F7|nr:NUDIX domain-containing protein [Brevibacillus dissolubilis]